MIYGGRPNFFATLVLIAGGLVALSLFRGKRPYEAAALGLIGCAMFLPEKLELDPPLLPPFDKVSIPALGTFAGAMIWARAKLARAGALRGVDLLFVIALCMNVFTVINNGDQVPNAYPMGKPLPLFDIFSQAVRDIPRIFFPFFVGRALLTSRRDLNAFMRIMVMAGVIYSFFAMIELRLSPQLHRWIYGYHQHNFAQTIRSDGYRPMVFMTHGLNASRFMLMTLLAATALYKAKQKVWNVSCGWWVIYLAIILVLWKSTGATLLAAVVVPIMILTGFKNQLRFAVLLAMFVIIYPALRTGGMIPIEDILDWVAENVDPKRAKSLEDRFEQEDALLGKLVQKPLAGWGGDGRYNIFDPITREKQTVDPEWLLVFGKRGLVGLACLWGLYLFPVFLSYLRADQCRKDDAAALAGFAVIIAVVTFDNLLNSTGTLPQYFMAGSLVGAATNLPRQRQAERRAARRERLRAAHEPEPEPEEREPAPAQ